MQTIINFFNHYFYLARSQTHTDALVVFLASVAALREQLKTGRVSLCWLFEIPVHHDREVLAARGLHTDFTLLVQSEVEGGLCLS